MDFSIEKDTLAVRRLARDSMAPRACRQQCKIFDLKGANGRVVQLLCRRDSLVHFEICLTLFAAASFATESTGDSLLAVRQTVFHREIPLVPVLGCLSPSPLGERNPLAIRHPYSDIDTEHCKAAYLNAAGASAADAVARAHT